MNFIAPTVPWETNLFVSTDSTVPCFTVILILTGSTLFVLSAGVPIALTVPSERAVT